MVLSIRQCPSELLQRCEKQHTPIDIVGEKGFYRFCADFEVASKPVSYHLISMTDNAIDAGVRIGHVHLKVANLERALQFYRDVLGFTVVQKMGQSAAFVAAGDYHHHIGLNTWESAGGSPPAAGTTGLYHLAIVYPTEAALGDALKRLVAAGIPLEGAADHGVSKALYLRDPDGNGVELYWDRPVEQWPRDASGELAMYTRPLDFNKLLEPAS